LVNHRKVPNRKAQSGFTLIEFIIAITILGILTSYAVPAFVNYLDNYRVEGTQRNFASAFKLAQSEAIKSTHQGVLCIAAAAVDTCDTAANAEWQQGWYVFEDVNNNGVIDTGEPIIKFQAPINNIHFFSETGTTRLTFDGSGALLTGAGLPQEFRICTDRPTDQMCMSEQASDFFTLASGQFIFN